MSLLGFKEYLDEQTIIGEQANELLEALITFGGKAYPQFGNIVIMAGGAGCHSKGTEVLMYDGTYKKVEDVKVDDKLMGIDSKQRTVKELHNGIDKMIEVKGNKGDSYICNYDHIHTFVASTDKCGFKKNEIYDMTFDEYQKLPKSAKKSLKIFKSNEIEFQNDEYKFEIDPWIIGFWIGNGTRNVPQFTIQDNSPIIEHIKQNYQNDKYYFNDKHIKTKPNCKSYSLITKKKKNPFAEYVTEKCQKNEEKRIPFELLTSSIKNRKSLLAGLIDSDENCSKGNYEILTKWKSLSDDIEFLCGSLGYRTKSSIKKVEWNGEIKEYHKISISGDFKDLPIVLEYKQPKQPKNKDSKRMSFEMTVLEEGEYFGFSLAEEDKHFILKNWLVQHNSGKGFVKDKLVGIEGKVFDVDALKTLASKTPKIQKRVKDEFNTDLEKLAGDLKNSDNVFKLHQIIGDELNIPNKQQKNFYTSVITAPADRKPNIIFDVTLKDLRKLEKITKSAQEIGYAKENIHIVWVVNDIEVAKAQNLKRDRTVPVEILVGTHRGASQTMADIVNMGKDLSKYMDGDIVFAFNKVGIDSEVAKSDNGGMYIKDANYFYVKRKGKMPTPVDSLTQELRHKIAQYVPKNVDWE